MFKAYKKMLLDIKKEIFANSFWIGEDPSNLDYGLATLVTGFFWVFLTITSPIWAVVWLIGAIVSLRNKGL